MWKCQKRSPTFVRVRDRIRVDVSRTSDTISVARLTGTICPSLFIKSTELLCVHSVSNPYLGFF